MESSSLLVHPWIRETSIFESYLGPVVSLLFLSFLFNRPKRRMDSCKRLKTQTAGHYVQIMRDTSQVLPAVTNDFLFLLSVSHSRFQTHSPLQIGRLFIIPGRKKHSLEIIPAAARERK